MNKISNIVAEILEKDDLVQSLGTRGLLNTSAYAREIKPEIEERLMKDVDIGSISAAVSRHLSKVKTTNLPTGRVAQQISVHSDLAGLSYERTDEISAKIADIYKTIENRNKTYLTVTQGINEITLVAERSVAESFKNKLSSYPTIYYKDRLVGITVKFDLKFLEIPNLIYALTRRLALKNVNIVEIISTASELTFVIEREDLEVALNQLQRDL